MNKYDLLKYIYRLQGLPIKFKKFNQIINDILECQDKTKGSHTFLTNYALLEYEINEFDYFSLLCEIDGSTKINDVIITLCEVELLKRL